MNELCQFGLKASVLVIAQASPLELHAFASGAIVLLHAILLFVVMRSSKYSPNREQMIHNAKFIGMHFLVLLGTVNFGVLRNERLKQFGIFACATILVPVFIFWIRGSKRPHETATDHPSPSSPNDDNDGKAK